MFIATQFIIVKFQKQSEYPTVKGIMRVYSHDEMIHGNENE